MLNKHTAIKYETPYTGPFVITRCFANGMVNLQCYEIQIKYNIHHISPSQLIFCRDIILPIKHMADWELIRQQKQKN